MCGIIIANTKDKFVDTYNRNRERGDYSFGAVYIKKDQYQVTRSLQCHIDDIPTGADTYLGHTRSPTCGHGADFDPFDSHPFESISWIVGHNGIIKNAAELKDKYKFSCGSVDSGVIPWLMQRLTPIPALEELQGIYGIWAYRKLYGDIFVARCSSTIYYSESSNIISSAKIEDSVLLDEGVLYQWRPNRSLETIGKFKYDSPYFVL